MDKKLIAIAVASMGLVAGGALAHDDQMNGQQSQYDQSSVSPSAQSSEQSMQQSAQSSEDSETVKQVQSALANQGYDPGSIDGQLSSQTQDALKQAQHDNGLSETGQIDDNTLIALGVGEPDQMGQTWGGSENLPESNTPESSDSYRS